MAKRALSRDDQTRLMQNENVLGVSEITITYAPAFKIRAVRSSLTERKAPIEIFVEAGFDLDMIGHENPGRCLERWRKTFEQRGEEGLREDKRGKNSTGRPAERELTLEERLRRAELRVKYLEKENEFLKKLDRLERSVVDKASAKYPLIQALVASGDAGFTVSYLCEVAGVSRSGYYRWLQWAGDRARREESDRVEYLVINEIFVKKNRKAGWRAIRMNLERKSVIMNHKKIRRLMKKYGLVAGIRRRNPYKSLARATQEHRTVPNILDRKFTQEVPNKAFGTDITYLRDGSSHRYFLSVLRDMATGEIVAHHLSSSLGNDLSMELIRQAVAILGEKIRGALIHSDQGSHYTHPTYTKYLAELGIVQSMSRKGNCLDNAPVESFFGHLKDELDLAFSHTFAQVRALIDSYIYDYNNHRYQWTRKKMAPVEYRNHLLTA